MQSNHIFRPAIPWAEECYEGPRGLLENNRKQIAGPKNTTDRSRIKLQTYFLKQCLVLL